MSVKNITKVAISIRSYRVLQTFLEENPKVKEIFTHADDLEEALENLKGWVFSFLNGRNDALAFYEGRDEGRIIFEKLDWQEVAAIRILDYIDNRGRSFEDLNLGGARITNNPFLYLWHAIRSGRGGGTTAYFTDMLELFRQFTGKSKRVLPTRRQVEKWMDRHPSGLDPAIIKVREANRERILKIIIRRIDRGEIRSSRYRFEPGLSNAEKMKQALKWWNTSHFHLKFAIRNPDLLNEMLDYSLDPQTLKVMENARKKGIPFFVNPYYLSLLNVDEPAFARGADQAIRDYIFVSQDLIEEFGDIVAWEKEDVVEPGKPNAAGWILPSLHNVHRRYPEVAILIPDTVGRACGGLCVSCQRMYDFQSGHLNFDLEKLEPRETWPHKLKRLLTYWENDAQLRDILITGGDSLMNSDKSLRLILDSVYDMAVRKKEANKHRPENERYAEMLRVRLGTRLPVYMPQRITDNLQKILHEFKLKASRIGFRQFVIQTHFISPMEVTPEVKKGVQKLIAAGWIVSNQQVFTAAAARRGHTAKLRKVLNDIGVLTYYTFSVKGYQENKHNFATNARAIQEQREEKVLGEIPRKFYETIRHFPDKAEEMVENINSLRQQTDMPFLGTDRNVINLPGVGKSQSFRTIGITHDGRRILEFAHDPNRNHSPIVDEMGKVVIIESKSINTYMRQLKTMGEDLADYDSLYGYSIGATEPRIPIYEYPGYAFEPTGELTNFKMLGSMEMSR